MVTVLAIFLHENEMQFKVLHLISELQNPLLLF
jgi:hypothetical protein